MEKNAVTLSERNGSFLSPAAPGNCRSGAHAALFPEVRRAFMRIVALLFL
jgi:hypothetical protein